MLTLICNKAHTSIYAKLHYISVAPEIAMELSDVSLKRNLPPPSCFSHWK